LPLKRFLLGVALVLLGAIAQAADSCEASFHQSGDVNKGLVFNASLKIPELAADSALAQMRSIAAQEGFLIGAQSEGRLALEQKASDNARGFPVDFISERDQKFSLIAALPPGMSGRVEDFRPVMCGMLAKLQTGVRGEALAAEGRKIQKNAVGTSKSEVEFKPAPPALTDEIGDWWLIFAEGATPEREVLFADAHSVKPLPPDADGKTALAVTASRIYESANISIDYAVFQYQVRCEEHQVRTASTTVTLRDSTTLAKAGSGEWRSSKGSVLERVHDFACEPKQRAKEKSMMLHAVAAPIELLINGTWGTLWQDGQRPVVARRTADQMNESRAVSAADLAKSFEEEQ
jgi:hypothetical protein